MKSILSTLVVLSIASTLLGQSLPEAVKQKFPLRNPPSALKVDKTAVQIERFDSSASENLSQIKLPSSLGNSFTFTFWVNFPNADLLNASAWNSETPMTIAVINTADNEERFVLRLPKGQLAVAATNNNGKKWETFTVPFTFRANNWYLVCLTKDQKETKVYIDATSVATSSVLPVVPNINTIAYGRFGSQRYLEGSIIQPRLYKSILSAEQIQSIFRNQRPADAGKSQSSAATPKQAATENTTSKEIPAPLSQKFPLRRPPSEVTVNTAEVQIDKVECGEGVSIPQISLPKALDDNFTLTLWFKTSRSDILEGASWNTEVPMTVAVLNTKDNHERLVIRLPKSRVALAATNDNGKNWPFFETSTKLESNKWYFLTVSKDNTRTLVYLNSAFAGSSTKLPDIGGIDNITYGRYGSQRFLHGTILQPRIYKGILSTAQINELYTKQRPSEIPAETLGKAETLSSSYGRYPALQVVKDELHPLIDHLHLGATVITDPENPQKKNILLAGLHLNYFGSRVAFFKPQGTDPAGLPYYDNGASLKNMQGAQFLAATHPDGSTQIYARGTNTPFGPESLIRYPITGYKDGLPQFGQPEAVLIDKKIFTEAFGPRASGWVIADIDGDDIPDLVVASIKSGVPRAYWPDQEGMWSNQERANSGKGRGYDIQGNWLGSTVTSELYWAKGNLSPDKKLEFSNKKPIYYQHEGFVAQWVTGESERGVNVIKLQGQPTLLQSGDVDKLFAMPVTVQKGEIILKKASLLLENEASVHGTYFIHNISVLDQKEDGSYRLLLDGNPGHLVVVEGKEIGKFKEVGSIQTKGGPIAADTLTTPIRGYWDEDNYPDLITGDASGFLVLWRGTADPLVYHAGQAMTVNGVPVHHQAGLTGSIQGPNELRWGYLQPTMGDWDDDMIPEIITNDITGTLMLYKQAPNAKSPAELTAPVSFKKDGEDYLIAWRTRPAIIPTRYNYQNAQQPVLLHIDWDGDLAVAITESKGSTNIVKVEKLRYEDGKPIRLCGPGGFWGRTKVSISEWNADGKWHVVFGSSRSTHRNYTEETLPGATPFLLENVGTNAKPVFKAARSIRLKDGSPIDLDIHNASASASNLVSKEGEKPDLIIGAEDGKVYYFPRSELKE